MQECYEAAGSCSNTGYTTKGDCEDATEIWKDGWGYETGKKWSGYPDSECKLANEGGSAAYENTWITFGASFTFEEGETVTQTSTGAAGTVQEGDTSEWLKVKVTSAAGFDTSGSVTVSSVAQGTPTYVSRGMARCHPAMVGNGKCDKACMSISACLNDGGDCRGSSPEYADEDTVCKLLEENKEMSGGESSGGESNDWNGVTALNEMSLARRPLTEPRAGTYYECRCMHVPHTG